MLERENIGYYIFAIGILVLLLIFFFVRHQKKPKEAITHQRAKEPSEQKSNKIGSGNFSANPTNSAKTENRFENDIKHRIEQIKSQPAINIESFILNLINDLEKHKKFGAIDPTTYDNLIARIKNERETAIRKNTASISQKKRSNEEKENTIKIRPPKP